MIAILVAPVNFSMSRMIRIWKPRVMIKWNNLKGRYMFLCTSSGRTEFNSLPNNKFLDWSKFKASADDKINVNEKFKFIFGRVENIVGKGENAGYQHFLLFPTMFSKGFILKVIKSRDCMVKS